VAEIHLLALLSPVPSLPTKTEKATSNQWRSKLRKRSHAHCHRPTIVSYFANAMLSRFCTEPCIFVRKQLRVNLLQDVQNNTVSYVNISHWLVVHVTADSFSLKYGTKSTDEKTGRFVLKVAGPPETTKSRKRRCIGTRLLAVSEGRQAGGRSIGRRR